MATLYSAQGPAGSAFGTLDPTTAAATTLATLAQRFTSLAFDPTDGTLYGTTSAASANPGRLYSIDPLSFTLTLVGSMGGAVSDIAFDSAGQMWGWTRRTANGGLGGVFAALLRIDKTDASFAVIGSSGLNMQGGGIAFDAGDVLFGLISVGASASLYTLDTGTGALSSLAVVGDIVSSASFDADGLLWYLTGGAGGSGVDLKTVDVGTFAGATLGGPGNNWDALAWTLPEVVVEPDSDPTGICIAFADEALAPDATFTRLDNPAGYQLASSFSIQRGRQDELAKTDTGRATVTFIDIDGTLDPTNLDGPFYGNLDPMKQAVIHIQHPLTEEWHALFTGFTSSYDHDLSMWGETSGLDTVTLELADLFDLIAGVQLTPGHHGYAPGLASFSDVYYKGTPSNLPDEPDVEVHVDDRINKILDDVGVPAGLRDIFSGNVTVQGVVYDREGDKALAALFDAADAEFPGVAQVYVSKYGYVRFRGRYARFYPNNPTYGINTWEAGGAAQALADPTVAPIAGLKFHRTKDDIINSTLATPAGVEDADIPDALVRDATSIDAFGLRSETFPNLLTSGGHNDDDSPTTAAEEVAKISAYYTNNYKVPRTIVRQLTFRPRSVDDPNAGALWDLICGIEIGDVINLETTHMGGGGFDEPFYAEGLRYEAHPMNDGMYDITLEVDVSPQSYFDDNPFGVFS